jgi:hypothetical protein
MKKTVFLVILAMATISLSAQKFGLKAGLNFSSYYGSDATDLKTLMGFQVGGLYEMPLSDNFFLEPSAMLTMKGAKSSGVIDSNMKPFYLEVPVRAMYKMDAGPGKFTLAVGPYVAMGLFGKSTTTLGGASISINLFTKEGGETEAMLKRFDMGISSAIGYELTNGLFFDVESSLGLLNVSSGSNTKNTTVSVVVGLKF